MASAWPWLALAGLGAFHGINPAMGWLFAVAIGLQRRSRAALLWSLLPIAAGHALSIALVVVALDTLRAFVDLQLLQVGAAVALIAFGVYRLAARHRARAGMQVTGGDLVIWSFLMATAHGAGLMLAPVLLGMADEGGHHPHAHMSMTGTIAGSAATSLAAVAIHTLAMLVSAGAVATAVYGWFGLGFLRRGWINLDLLWVFALIGAGGVLLILALW